MSYIKCKRCSYQIDEPVSVTVCPLCGEPTGQYTIKNNKIQDCSKCFRSTNSLSGVIPCQFSSCKEKSQDVKNNV